MTNQHLIDKLRDRLDDLGHSSLASDLSRLEHSPGSLNELWDLLKRVSGDDEL